MVEAQWARLLSRVSPVAVIAVSGAGAVAAAGAAAGPTEGLPQKSGGRGDTEGERAARRACEHAEVT